MKMSKLGIISLFKARFVNIVAFSNKSSNLKQIEKSFESYQDAVNKLYTKSNNQCEQGHSDGSHVPKMFFTMSFPCIPAL
jgi:hypothetical protein